MSQKFVEVFRGDRPESCHYGSLAVVDKNSNLLASAGEPGTLTFWRSAAKPVQILPVLTSGAAQHYQFTDEELAVMMASHSGQECHRKQVKNILDKIGADKEDLNCGIHPPIHKTTRRNLYRNQNKPDAIHNNCSGKHAAMLSLCTYHDWNLDNYFKKDHPLQQMMLNYIGKLTGYSADRIDTGIDGCGVIVYHIPIKNMATAYARLVNPVDLSESLQDACNKITEVMNNHPELIAGSGRFNKDLLADYTGDKILAKSGAEGIFCFAHNSGWGAAVKVCDGNKRAIPPVVLDCFKQLDKLNPEMEEQLQDYFSPDIKNHRDEKVGCIKSRLNLKLIKQEA